MSDVPSWAVERKRGASPKEGEIPDYAVPTDTSDYSFGAPLVDAIVGPGKALYEVGKAGLDILTPEPVKEVAKDVVKIATAPVSYAGNVGRAGIGATYELLSMLSDNPEKKHLMTLQEGLGAINPFSSQQAPTMAEMRERGGFGGDWGNIYKSRHVNLNVSDLFDLGGDVATNPFTYPAAGRYLGRKAQKAAGKVAPLLGKTSTALEETPRVIDLSGRAEPMLETPRRPNPPDESFLDRPLPEPGVYPEGTLVPNVARGLGDKTLKDKWSDIAASAGAKLCQFAANPKGAEIAGEYITNPLGKVMQEKGKSMYKKALAKIDELAEKEGQAFGDASNLLWDKGFKGSGAQVKKFVEDKIDSLDTQAYQAFDEVDKLAGKNSGHYMTQGSRMVSPTAGDMKYAYEVLDKAEEHGLNKAAVRRMRKIVDSYRNKPTMSISEAREGLRAIDREIGDAYRPMREGLLSDDVLKAMRNGRMEAIQSATELAGAEIGQSEIGPKLREINKTRSLLYDMQKGADAMAKKEINASTLDKVDMGLLTGTGAALGTGHYWSGAALGAAAGAKAGAKYLGSTAGKTRLGKGLYTVGHKKYMLPATVIGGEKVREGD